MSESNRTRAATVMTCILICLAVTLAWIVAEDASGIVGQTLKTIGILTIFTWVMGTKPAEIRDFSVADSSER